jgi:Ca-activated chloride channel family protein
MRPDRLPYWFGGTEIGKALRACRKVLIERQEGDRMIVLLTDGFSFDLTNGNDAAVAKELKESNITVFAVIIGDEPPPNEVATITSITGGEIFDAGDPEALKTVFKRIDQMKQAKMEKAIAETVDYFWPYCLVGLGLLGAAGLAALGLRYTPW